MEPVPAPPHAQRLARRILIAAAAVQFLLFVMVAQGPVIGTFTEPAVAQPFGPAIVGIDSHGYYAWLRSALADGDWDFDNEFAYYESITPGTEYRARTPTGMHANQWSIGPALVWAIGVVPVHAALGLFDARGTGIEVGYAASYQLAVCCVSLGLGIATLLLVYSTARRFAGPVASAVAAAALVLATPLAAYTSNFAGMAHGPAAASLAVFVYVWVRTMGSSGLGRWCGLGVLLGVACLMRWQLASFAVLLGLEAAWCAARERGVARLRWVGLLVLAGVGAVVGFAPQMIGWQVVYGSPYVSQHGFSPGRLLEAPRLWEVLVSFDRSFFYWTPITLLALVGGGYAVLRSPRRLALPLALLLLAAASQIYAMAVMLSNPHIYLGWSFGFRFLTETCVVLVPGLGVLIDRARPALARALSLAASALVGWNLLLLVGVRVATVNSIGPATPAELLKGVADTFERRPLEPLAVLVFSAWLTAVVVSAFRVRLPVAVPTSHETRRAA